MKTIDEAALLSDYFYLSESASLIEIKPQRLLQTMENQAKFAAAKVKWGERYRVLTEDGVNKVEPSELIRLVETGKVKLISRWMKKLYL